jgi:AraC-like DNA-binding protein
MLTLSYSPRAPLNQFVERLWLVSHAHCGRQECILPSGTVELVVNLCDDRVQIEGTVHGARGKTVSGVAVSGPYSEAFIIEATQHAGMMGVHFRPGGASAVLGVPCSELTDAHVNLASLWGEAIAGELRERLCAAPSHQARFRCLEDVLMRRLHSQQSRTRQSRHLREHPVVAFALGCFARPDARPSVRDVARELGLSHRRFLTIFTTEVGLPPKLYGRIIRFQQAHALAQRTGDVDWAQLALECGFCDQAHLVNEFRKLSGLTPTDYQRKIREQRDVLRGHVALS